MKILINDEEKNISSKDINGLIKELNLTNLDGIALAINNNVILRKFWDSTIINENDNIIIIQATKGG